MTYSNRELFKELDSRKGRKMLKKIVADHKKRAELNKDIKPYVDGTDYEPSVKAD